MTESGITAIDTEIPWGMEIRSSDDWLIVFRWDARNTHQNPGIYRFLCGLYYVVALIVMLGMVWATIHGTFIDFNELQIATTLFLGIPLCLGLYLNACRCFFPLVQETTIYLDPGEIKVERTVFGVSLPTLELENAGPDDWNLELKEGKRFRDFKLNTMGWKEEKTIQLHLNEKQAKWMHHLINEVV